MPPIQKTLGGFQDTGPGMHAGVSPVIAAPVCEVLQAADLMKSHPFQKTGGIFQDLRVGKHAGVDPVTSTSIFKGLQKAGLIDRQGWGHYPVEKDEATRQPTDMCAPNSTSPSPSNS